LADLPAAASGNAVDAPLDAAARAALGVVDGDTVRCVPLHGRGEAASAHGANPLSGDAR
ncbi:arginine/ornithine succinyltransferase subunit alpha, partial [Burkholderia sp. Ac-20379]|nr:arginine/ornithine succinyltransferase subunit alpha [Burkholderia sp. Ac-20379]